MIKATQSRPREAEFAAADAKEQGLRNLMRGMKRVLVAYSGGVDSTYLAVVATQELGSNAICVTGISPSVSEHQKLRAAEIAAQFTFNHKTVDTAEVENLDYRKNGADRCYFCKDELYSVLGRIAELYEGAAVLDGTNFDDLNDHRPGRIAAKNHNVISPLAKVGLTKDEIRAMSKRLGLP